MSKTKLAIAAAFLCGASLALGADTPADIDLRQAASLHRQGDTPAAVGLWEKWARQGNADAAYNLAVIHQHADGVAYDAAAALRWYRVAADLGDKVSQFQLGWMYQNGEGVPADAAIAHAWFTKHRQEHLHRHHNAQFRQWQQQALALVEERDRREAAAAARRDGAQVLAELRRRAGLSDVPVTLAAAPAPQPTSSQ